jgi:hypothetical protein
VRVALELREQVLLIAAMVGLEDDRLCRLAEVVGDVEEAPGVVSSVVSNFLCAQREQRKLGKATRRGHVEESREGCAATRHGSGRRQTPPRGELLRRAPARRRDTEPKFSRGSSSRSRHVS